MKKRNENVLRGEKRLFFLLEPAVRQPCLMFVLAFIFVCCVCCRVSAGDLQRFDNARLIEHPSNDGDSFKVDLNGEPFNFRLYYVDCPETSADGPGDAQRVREQTRYWGLPDPARTVHFGREATRFTQKALSGPFTVYTAFANAPSRSAGGRFYAFVITADNQDLATLLVKKGLARVRGIGRRTPDDVSRDEMIAQLQDIELAAALKRVGIWSETDPDLIPSLRRDTRMEEDDLRVLKERLHPSSAPDDPVDPNTASLEELESVPGIGPVLSRRIVDGRPYETLEDLLNVSGIGPRNLERWRRYLHIVPEPQP